MSTPEPGSICPFGPQFQEDWDLLTPLERSFKFDEYGLYAVTPQLYSRPIVQKISGEHVIDACCSIGGMAIALALTGKLVTAIELVPGRLALARENATIAGVSDRITFIQGDTLEVLPSVSADTVFFDGQWAGPDQASGRKFGLADFRPDGQMLLELAFSQVKEVVLRTPPHFDFDELDSFERRYVREPTVVDSRVRGYTVYFEPRGRV